MDTTEIYQKIRELQDLKDSVESDIKKYKNMLDSELLPERDPEIKIIEVPEYIEDIGEYLSQRYPTFDLVSLDQRTAKIKEKEAFVPKKIVFENGAQFYRRISHGKPTINTDLLQKNYPSYFQEIITLVPEIDEQKLNNKLENDPDFLRVIEEVLEMTRPSVALVATKPTEE
jgi:hypothetical protein